MKRTLTTPDVDAVMDGCRCAAVSRRISDGARFRSVSSDEPVAWTIACDRRGWWLYTVGSWGAPGRAATRIQNIEIRREHAGQ